MCFNYFSVFFVWFTEFAVVPDCDGSGDNNVEIVSLTYKVTSNDNDYDAFGHSVSISGGYAIIGAENNDATGVDTGSAYIFTQNSESNRWIQAQKLISGEIADNAAFGEFGRCVSISNDYIIVGGRKANEFALWDDLSGTGSAYIFEKNDNGSWVEVAMLYNRNYNFGHSVDIDDDYAIVGAYAGDNDEDFWVPGTNSSSAHIYQRRQSDGKWIQVQNLTSALDTYLDDGIDGVKSKFGWNVAISGDTAFVGAPWDINENGLLSGSVYVYQRNNVEWNFVKKLVADDGEAGDCFGYSMAVYGDLIIVGAKGNCNNGADVNQKYGSVYVFQRQDGSWNSWIQVVKLIAHDSNENVENGFGSNVSINKNYAVIGAAINGSVYVFETNTWSELFKLVANDEDVLFSGDVSISADNVIAIGASTNDAAYFFQPYSNYTYGPTMDPTPFPSSSPTLLPAGTSSDKKYIDPTMMYVLIAISSIAVVFLVVFVVYRCRKDQNGPNQYLLADN